MTSRVLRVAPLLFVSGLTSLVYQVAWMRELRLIFGFSTAASAAALAIFFGGLGVGSWLLGRRADEASRPVVFYGKLELAISASAACTPALLWVVQKVYVALGGTFALGIPLGTAVRLLLSAIVLGAPTVLMGGTLPALTRAVETDEDSNRRRVALLYGANTLGAAAGAALATFWLLEALGTSSTLWAACCVNAGVGCVALFVGKAMVVRYPETAGTRDAAAESIPVLSPATFVLGAAGVTGFAFAAMELVWYRMLGPLLGGSTYTFGLILAVALFGIGLGAAVYGAFGARWKATRAALATTCAFEALFLAIPYALGDRLAIFAALARPMGSFGFAGYVWGWAMVAAVVVLPAAIAAGVQFPLLVALFGRGRDNVGRQVGAVYASNTLGAIIGSCAAGFGMLPLLSATGSWVAIVLLLVVLGALALLLAPRHKRAWLSFALPVAALGASLLFLRADGPTAAWRHSPIGAGRVQLSGSSPNGLQAWVRGQRQQLQWQADGVESSVGLIRTSVGFAFAINGKIDGSAIGDAATQVMGGLLPAALHPAPKRALVIGLGTGSTAGWLGAVPSIERVDVVELERAVLEVARQCRPVNLDPLANPKVRIWIGDAREFLLTSQSSYDVIFSEPSNPYRAGVSSLFTREFYRAAASRLAPGGLFVQWLQAYEVDPQTVKTSYATLASVFGSVETWFTKRDDLLLVASAQPHPYRISDLRRRLQEEPFRNGMAAAWRVAGVEGLFSHYVARDSLARSIAHQPEAIPNTDDRNRMEFGFARSLGQSGLFQSDELRRIARDRGEDRPAAEGELDWTAVERQRLATLSAEGVSGPARPEWPLAEQQRAAAHQAFVEGRLGEVRGLWLEAPWEPSGPLEMIMIGEALADGGDSRAVSIAANLRAAQPAEADAVLARFLWTQQKWSECFAAAAAALERYRTDPWPLHPVMRRLLAILEDVPARDPSLGKRGCDLLASPFAVSLLDDERTMARIAVCQQVDPFHTAEALRDLEPNVPWNANLLEIRAAAYEAASDPRSSVARAERDAFWRRESRPMAEGLEPSPRQPR